MMPLFDGFFGFGGAVGTRLGTLLEPPNPGDPPLEARFTISSWTLVSEPAVTSTFLSIE